MANVDPFVGPTIEGWINILGNVTHLTHTGTQESYWTKAARPIYPDLDCRCGAESTGFREDEP